MNLDWLIGRSIVAIRAMTEDEIECEGWHGLAHYPITVIELDDGTILYASRDEEGNGPGEIFGAEQDGRMFMIFLVEEE